MKKIKKIISWWLVLPFFCLVVLIGCKSREKQVQKTETQTEKKSEATARIEEKTYEIIFDKELSNFGKSKTDKSEETSKTETKNVEIIKEYYENGTLKKEMQRNFSELAETTKKAISELEEKINAENIEKGKAIINKLIDVYNEDAIKDKNSESKKTIEFIDDSLAIISGKLGQVEAQ